MGGGIRDEYEITLKIKTFDGDPKKWDWIDLIGDEVTITNARYVGRVFDEPLKEESKSWLKKYKADIVVGVVCSVFFLWLLNQVLKGS